MRVIAVDRLPEVAAALIRILSK